MAEGLSNRQIAHRLQVRESTVKSHLHRVFERIGGASRVDVAFHYWRGRFRTAEICPHCGLAPDDGLA